MQSFNSLIGSIVALLLPVLAADAQAQGFTPLVYPDSVKSRASGIDRGIIVGWQQPMAAPGSVPSGYQYNGSFNELQFPGGSQTTPRDISGDRIVGTYTDGTTLLDESFIYDNGNWTNLKNPAYTYTFAESVDGNRVAGWLTSGPGSSTGFIYDGSWKTLSYPGSESTRIFGIDGPNVVGTYRDESFNTYGFLYDGTNWTAIDFPGGSSTQPRAISGNFIVGSYTDNGGATRGFRFDGRFWHTLNLPASTSSSNNGVDGQTIVGEYTEDRVTHGFFTPAIAGPQEFKFAIRGEITLVEDAGNRFAGAFHIGDPVEGTYNYFDGRYVHETVSGSTATNAFTYYSSLGGANFYDVDPVPISFQLKVGDNLYETGNVGNLPFSYTLGLTNDDDGTSPPFFKSGDEYRLQSPLDMPDNFVDVENAFLITGINLYDDTGLALSSSDFPVTAPDVSKFASRIGRMSLYDASSLNLLGRIEYRVDSLVADPDPLPGDFNHDDHVDAADYTVWRNGLGMHYTADQYADWKYNFGAGQIPGDFNNDERVDATDYTVWRNGLGTLYTADQYADWKNNFGADRNGDGSAANSAASIPEPSSVQLSIVYAALASALVRGQHFSRGARLLRSFFARNHIDKFRLDSVEQAGFNFAPRNVAPMRSFRKSQSHQPHPRSVP